MVTFSERFKVILKYNMKTLTTPLINQNVAPKQSRQ